jgi:biotin carboxylase
MSQFTNTKEEAVIVVDPYSTGGTLAFELNRHGFKVISVHSEEMDKSEELKSMVPHGLKPIYEAAILYEGDHDHMLETIDKTGFKIIAVLAGAETGVHLADELSERLGLLTNGTAFTDARRNKYLMGEAVRASGLRAVQQSLCSTWAEVTAVIDSWQPSPFRVVLKPVESAGGDCVALCSNMDEVRAAFDAIVGKPNGLGMLNTYALVQEYLDGPEYVIDMVSRDGVHKAASVIAYDRRAINGIAFACCGERFLWGDSEKASELIAYQKGVLDALGIKNGPSHGEVKWFKGEPVLVEVGARCHGCEGAWKKLEDRAYGANQATLTVEAYLFPERFTAAPDRVRT